MVHPGAWRQGRSRLPSTVLYGRMPLSSLHIKNKHVLYRVSPSPIIASSVSACHLDPHSAAQMHAQQWAGRQVSSSRTRNILEPCYKPPSQLNTVVAIHCNGKSLLLLDDWAASNTFQIPLQNWARCCFHRRCLNQAPQSTLGDAMKHASATTRRIPAAHLVHLLLCRLWSSDRAM